MIEVNAAQTNFNAFTQCIAMLSMSRCMVSNILHTKDVLFVFAIIVVHCLFAVIVMLDISAWIY